MHHDNVSTRCQQWEVGPGSGGGGSLYNEVRSEQVWTFPEGAVSCTEGGGAQGPVQWEPGSSGERARPESYWGDGAGTL